MSELASRRCVPCAAGTGRLSPETLGELQRALGHSWQVVDQHHLEKTFRFKNFRQALEFTKQVGELAEVENHHPDIHLAWGKVAITLWTHSAGGLTENDFILAAKIEQLPGAAMV